MNGTCKKGALLKRKGGLFHPPQMISFPLFFLDGFQCMQVFVKLRIPIDSHRPQEKEQPSGHVIHPPLCYFLFHFRTG